MKRIPIVDKPTIRPIELGRPWLRDTSGEREDTILLSGGFKAVLIISLLFLPIGSSHTYHCFKYRGNRYKVLGLMTHNTVGGR